jgi:hypothetical protein
MLTNSHRKNTFGQLEGLSESTAILKVVSFVEKHLVLFSDKYAGSSITNEKGLTQALCILLNKYARCEGYPFQFEKEFMEDVKRGNSPQVDIGVVKYEDAAEFVESQYYSCHGAFFSMEAKRLDKTTKAREKEYLVGHIDIEKNKYIDCGGVERFKKGIHGQGLKCAGVIGYVQKYNFDYWHNTIDTWIDNLIKGEISSQSKWSIEDKLVEEYKNSITAKFKSQNSRPNGSILLFHLWVNLVKLIS